MAGQLGLVVMVLVAVIGMSNGLLRKSSDTKCFDSPHEEHVPCRSECQPSCDNPTPKHCTEKCVPGCNCAMGYLRNSQNKCIRPADCPQVAIYGFLPIPKPVVCPNNCTGPHEECVLCKSQCERTCARVQNPSAEQCSHFQGCSGPVCQCKEGFYRHESGLCLTDEQCRAGLSCNRPCSGGPHDKRVNCASVCVNTCERPIHTLFCEVKECVPDGCECEFGWVRRSDGQCVRKSECPREN